MLPNDYELHLVQHRYHELRHEAEQYRLATINQHEPVARPTLSERLRELLVRALTHQPATSRQPGITQAEAPA